MGALFGSTQPGSPTAIQSMIPQAQADSMQGLSGVNPLAAKLGQMFSRFTDSQIAPSAASAAIPGAAAIPGTTSATDMLPASYPARHMQVQASTPGGAFARNNLTNIARR